ncbi:MAG: GFA family protein [Novosphingobium sp.]
MSQPTMTLMCLCGAVRIELAARPDYLHACNCTLCRKTGAWWGYFDPKLISVVGLTASFVRSDKPSPGTAVHFCPACGVTTHFVLTPQAIALHGNVVGGANLRLADPRDLAGVELRFPDGAAWSGEGPFGFVRPAEMLTGDAD